MSYYGFLKSFEYYSYKTCGLLLYNAFIASGVIVLDQVLCLVLDFSHQHFKLFKGNFTIKRVGYYSLFKHVQLVFNCLLKILLKCSSTIYALSSSFYF